MLKGELNSMTRFLLIKLIDLIALPTAILFTLGVIYFFIYLIWCYYQARYNNSLTGYEERRRRKVWKRLNRSILGLITSMLVLICTVYPVSYERMVGNSFQKYYSNISIWGTGIENELQDLTDEQIQRLHDLFGNYKFSYNPFGGVNMSDEWVYIWFTPESSASYNQIPLSLSINNNDRIALGFNEGKKLYYTATTSKKRKLIDEVKNLIIEESIEGINITQ